MTENTNSLINHPFSPDKVFRKKFEKIYGTCWGIARRWSNHSAALQASDLAQVAVTKVWLARAQFVEDMDIMPLVVKIAVNAYKDICKSLHNEDGTPLDDAFMETLPNDAQETCEEADHLDSAILEDENCSADIDLESFHSILTPRQMLIIEKSYAVGDCQWEQCDERIADDLGLSRQTVIAERKKALTIMRNRNKKRTSRGIAA